MEDDGVVISRTADEILAKPEYQPPERGLITRALDWVFGHLGDALRWVLEQLDRILGRGAGGGTGVGPGGYVIGWILLIAALAVVVWLLVRVMPRRRLRRAQKQEPTVERTRRNRVSRDRWLELAAAAQAEGRHRDAVRCRYRALVCGLADRHELDPNDAVTSGEHLRSFTAAAPKTAAFATATDRYERAWFGDEPVGEGEVALLERIDDELLVHRHRSDTADGAAR